jgi:hypothetical protein
MSKSATWTRLQPAAGEHIEDGMVRCEVGELEISAGLIEVHMEEVGEGGVKEGAGAVQGRIGWERYMRRRRLSASPK